MKTQQSSSGDGSGCAFDELRRRTGSALVATEQLHAIISMLQVASERKQTVPEPALHNLGAVSRALEETRVQFDAEFDRQLQLHSKGPHPTGAAMAENSDPWGNLNMPADEA